MTDSFLFLFTEYFLAQRLWHACTHDIDVHSPGVFTKRVTSFMTCSKVSVRAFLIANSGAKTFVGLSLKIVYTKTSACAPSKHWNTHTHCFVYFWKNKKGPGHRGNFHEPNYQTTIPQRIHFFLTYLQIFFMLVMVTQHSKLRFCQFQLSTSILAPICAQPPQKIATLTVSVERTNFSKKRGGKLCTHALHWVSYHCKKHCSVNF